MCCCRCQRRPSLSDTLLALRMFAGLRPLGPYAVILTYWFGQLGITLSAAWQQRGQEKNEG